MLASHCKALSLAVVEGKFSRRSRLLKPDEYRRVFDAGKRSRDQYFMVFARVNGLEYARLGLAITKKKTKRAVDRNRLKRQVRESFRSYQHLLAGLDLVVLNQKGELLAENSQYRTSLSQHWQRLVKKCAQS